ncbi:MAG: xylose isomerase [Candidatus Latescibacteria bacterium]|jgi:hypothetical protein|nr:xylose isomerase [Candidatus Latescibacterota bacterium]
MKQHVQLTVLNGMAGNDVEACMDQHLAWGLQVLDLKDRIFGKGVEHLNQEDAEKVAVLASDRKLSVHTLSTGVFHSDIEVGEDAFRQQWFPLLENAIVVAKILKPGQVRLLMAGSHKRADVLDSSVYLAETHPWVYGVYREAVDRISDAGFHVVIENEVRNCLFSSAQEILSFFEVLDQSDAVSLIWDAQNLWQMGTFPTLEVYHMLRPLIGMVHVKGGRAEVPGGPLVWKAGLEDASWPVVSILKAAIADGVSPVICLNPSHGQKSDNYVEDVAENLAFLRREIEEVA